MGTHAIIGRLTIDYIVTADDQIHEGLLGGGAAYSAAGARLWSPSVSLLACIGPEFPDRLLADLRSYGLDVSGLHRSDRDFQQRTFFSYPELTQRQNGKPTPDYLRLGEPLPKELLDYDPARKAEQDEALDPVPETIELDGSICVGAHLAPMAWNKTNLISSRLRERGVPWISVDPHTAHLRPGEYEPVKLLLHDVDVFLPSRSQAETLFRPHPKDAWETVETFASWGPRIVILKCGPSGQIVYDREADQGWVVPAYPTDPKDVTGAGHAFCGGFLVGLARTGDPLEAALHGNVAASLAVEGVGALYPLECLAGLAEARLASLRSACRQRLR